LKIRQAIKIIQANQATYKRGCRVMSKNYLSKDVNKEICNAFGCSEKATEKINLSAGKFGEISLNLCDKCIKKFQ
jgi:hypothetical protein